MTDVFPRISGQSVDHYARLKSRLDALDRVINKQPSTNKDAGNQTQNNVSLPTVASTRTSIDISISTVDFANSPTPQQPMTANGTGVVRALLKRYFGIS